MNYFYLALLFTLLVVPHGTRAQSVARASHAAESSATELPPELRTLAALQRLQSNVIVYRSLGEFEAEGRLGQVSFERFNQELEEVTAEVEPLVSQIGSRKLRVEFTNTLDSYRDGAFWWRRVDHPRVVHVTALSYSEPTPSEAALLATIPYTVIIHWRQAEKYLRQAESTLNQLQIH